ncbi:MAG: hypothetical protein AAF074_26760 [Pseudomonadota bacterium]
MTRIARVGGFARSLGRGLGRGLGGGIAGRPAIFALLAALHLLAGCTSALSIAYGVSTGGEEERPVPREGGWPAETEGLADIVLDVHVYARRDEILTDRLEAGEAGHVVILSETTAEAAKLLFLDRKRARYRILQGPFEVLSVGPDLECRGARFVVPAPPAAPDAPPAEFYLTMSAFGPGVALEIGRKRIGPDAPVSAPVTAYCLPAAAWRVDTNPWRDVPPALIVGSLILLIPLAIATGGTGVFVLAI